MLHEEGFRPIPKRGVGWKIFGVGAQSPNDCEGLVIGSVHGVVFKRDRDGWVAWKWEDDPKDRGFCFFLKRKDAVSAARKWLETINRNPGETCVVLKIEYEGGLGECDEHRFVGGTVRVALARRFRIVGVEGR